MMKDIVEGIAAARRILKNDYPDSKKAIDKSQLKTVALTIIDDPNRSRADKAKANTILGKLKDM